MSCTSTERLHYETHAVVGSLSNAPQCDCRAVWLTSTLAAATPATLSICPSAIAAEMMRDLVEAADK